MKHLIISCSLTVPILALAACHDTPRSIALPDVSTAIVSIGQPFFVTTDANSQSQPRISGDRVVWFDSRDSGNYNQPELYMFDFVSGTETRINPGRTVHGFDGMALDGDRVVYGFGNPMYVFDLATGVESVVTSAGAYPSISGDRIAWSALGIFVTDLSTGTEVQLASAGGWGRLIDPDISGDLVVWDDYNGGVHLHDLSTGIGAQIGASGASEPAISGELVVWRYRGAGGGRGIYLYDRTTGDTRPLVLDDQASNPDISGSLVVWDSYSAGFYRDIHLYDLSTDMAYRLTASSENNYGPKISGNRVVWTVNSFGAADVMAVELSTASFEELDTVVDDLLEQGEMQSGATTVVSALADQAAASLEQGNTNAGIAKLNALIRATNAQVGRTMTQEAADQIIAIAEALIANA